MPNISATSSVSGHNSVIFSLFTYLYDSVISAATNYLPSFKPKAGCSYYYRDYISSAITVRTACTLPNRYNTAVINTIAIYRSNDYSSRYLHPEPYT